MKDGLIAQIKPVWPPHSQRHDRDRQDQELASWPPLWGEPFSLAPLVFPISPVRTRGGGMSISSGEQE